METIYELVERVLDGFEQQDRIIGSNIHRDAADEAFEQWLGEVTERAAQESRGE